MIIGIEGLQGRKLLGNGKTLTLTYLTYLQDRLNYYIWKLVNNQEFKQEEALEFKMCKDILGTIFSEEPLSQKAIITNYKVTFPHQELTWDFLDKIDTFGQSFIAADELWLLLDSYDFHGKKNQFLQKVMLNTRRRGNHLIYTVQRAMNMQVRVRTATDVWIMPDLNKQTGVCKCTVLHNAMDKAFSFSFHAEPIYKLYSTSQEMTYMDYDAIKVKKEGNNVKESVKKIKK